LSVATTSREGFAPVAGAELYYRDIGEGRPLIVIHGGPDFDHRYLLPDMDRLADSFRLVYYDQRGRGRSRGEVRPEEIGIETYVADLEGLRGHLGLGPVAVLGHSWGGLVAMHYALRHPRSLSHMVLLNTIPASHDDLILARAERLARRATREEELAALMPGYARGDPEAVEQFYRIDFGSTFRRPADLARLRLAWTREDILRGRAIEARLNQGLVWSEGYTLLPALAAVRTPTLVVHGEIDFFTPGGSKRIAEAIPAARLAVLPDSGHFSYVDAPEALREALEAFFISSPRSPVRP
jgi:proline iminopeptidase